MTRRHIGDAADMLGRRAAAATDDVAPSLGAEAIDLFVYRIGRELGSLAAALGGLDALVFTAGIGQHANRVGARDRKKWNYAGDAWINDTLDDSKIGTRIPNCVNMAGSKDLTVESIYDNLPDNGGGGGGC